MNISRTFALLFVIACVMMSGCCNVYNHRGFGAVRGIDLVKGIRTSLYLSPKSETSGLPGFFEYVNRFGPYDLSVNLMDIDPEIDSFELTDIRLTYANGEVVDKTCWWRENFRSRAERERAAGRPTSKHKSTGETIEGLVDQLEDVTITLKGRVTKSNGEIIEFVAKESFQSERSFSIVPLFLHGA